MYTRESNSWDIAADVLAEGSARSHTLQECWIKQDIWHFLAGDASAATLGGWIKAVREHRHFSSQQAMVFIYCHKYLRELFEQDVLDEFCELSLMNPASASMLATVAGGLSVLSPEVENALPNIPLPLSEHWRDLDGEF